jgi:aminoglycoside phosphotransferase (APT) family kinase protein
MSDLTSIDHLRNGLTAFMTNETGASIHISHLSPLAGGASRESWLVDMMIDGQSEKLVLRKDLPTSMHQDALTRRQEFRVMQSAFDANVKCARMRFLCDDKTVLGMPFFLMDFVEGVSIGRKVITAPELEHARQLLPEQLAEQLALIHTIPYDDLDFLPRPAEGVVASHAAIKQTYKILDNLGVYVPVFEHLLRWATYRAPSDPELTFIHGDFRIGNILVKPDGLSAILDWEFVHIGNPAEEIGYLCMRDWRFGNDHLHAGGLCPRERFITAYEGYSGRRIDREAVDWWEVMGNIRWGIICLAQAHRYLSGVEKSVEYASLGRRSAEMQLEALNLIQKIG